MSARDDRDWSEPSEVHLTRIDVPFLDLTWFFVKASMAMAVAFLVTSWLWVVIGAGVVTLAAGLLVSAGVPAWFVPPPAGAVAMALPVVPLEPVAPAAHMAPAELVAPSEPAPTASPPEPVGAVEAPPPVEPVEAVRPIGQTEAARAASEAAQLAEIERIRRERGR